MPKSTAAKQAVKAAPARSDAAAYFFHEGTNYHAYEYLGAHKLAGGGYTFRVWCPNADRVSVIGDFNNWSPSEPLTKISEQGIFEGSIPAARAGMRYKFRITSPFGTFDRGDPYAFQAEKRPRTASVLTDPPKFAWTDESYRKAQIEKCRRDVRDFYPAPMNIYEMHLGSWMQKKEEDEDGDRFLTYRELADELIPYLLQLGVTHVEMLPLAEHPLDASWGYQVCGFYAPTSRFGSPDDLKFLINSLHEAGIGVILDWVPAHFPKDAHGLYQYDGGYVYEYQGRDRMEHAGWGTRFFDVGRGEVQCFLISNALYWMREFHVDGLRVDAVASMLYLDYDRSPGEWIPNIHGDNRNLESIAFFQKLNTAVASEFPGVLMIAEESGDWPAITKSVAEGGLGFHFKWNMGFANDLYRYISLDPVYRKYHQEYLTFSLMYAMNEHYVLPVSHDEVVHGKKSLLDKMYGSYEEKFAGMRTFLAYMTAHPGKKLRFMGCEFAPFREWDYADSLEWFMTDYDRHRQMQAFTAALNRFYLSAKELWEIDSSFDGFEWVMLDRAEENLIAFRRSDRAGNPILALFNFSPVRREKIPLRIRDPQQDAGKPSVWREVLNTDELAYGGSGVCNKGALKTKKENGAYVLHVSIGGHSAIYLRPVIPL